MKTVLNIVCAGLLLLCTPAPESHATGPGGPAGPGTPSQLPVVTACEVFSIPDQTSFHYTGRVVSPATVNLVARVSGEILAVDFHEGEQVQAGQVLYRLDPVRYAAAVKNAEGKLMQCQAEYTYARADLNRNRILFKRNAVSQDVLESSERTEKVRHGELLASEAELVTARDDLRNTKITAPFTGRIGLTAFTAGNYVGNSSGTLTTLIQTNPIRVRFALSTKDMLTIYGSAQGLRDSGRVRIRLADGTDISEEGHIIIVDNMAGSKTDTIQVFAEFSNSKDRLVAGSTVVATLVKEKKNACVPAVLPTAIMHDADGAFVFVLCADSHVQKRRVTLGDMEGEAQKILSGLQAGERVVKDGKQKLSDGVQVECLTKTTNSENTQVKS